MADYIVEYTPAQYEGLPGGAKPGEMQIVRRGQGTRDIFTSWVPFSEIVTEEEEITDTKEQAMNSLELFMIFHTLVVRDGIDPRVAHREFATASHPIFRAR